MNEDMYEIYEGTDSYLFISYSHQDSELVDPIIHGLQEMGYRLWYDTGIAVGSRWPDTIAEHLQESNCVVAFISANAMASDYCQEEIFFAMEEHKPLVAVHLEETLLPPGLKMRLSARQAIYRYKFKNNIDFLSKLDKEKVVRPSKDTNHNSTIETLAALHPLSSSEKFTDRYRELEYLLLDKRFITVGNLAINMKQFTARDMADALGSNSEANEYINKMYETGMIKYIGLGRFETVIDPSEWVEFKNSNTK